MRTPNKITGPNAGGPPQLPVRTRWAARVGQFCRYQAGKCQCSLDIEATGDKMAGKMMRDDFVTVPARGLREWPLPSAPSKQNEPLCNNIHPHARQLNRD